MFGEVKTDKDAIASVVRVHHLRNQKYVNVIVEAIINKHLSYRGNAPI